MALFTDIKPIFASSPEIEHINSRIHYKMQDYLAYRFTSAQACAINIFFDLAQEFDEPEQIPLMAVLILKHFFSYNAEIYLKKQSGELGLVTPCIAEPEPQVPSRQKRKQPGETAPPPLRPEVWKKKDRYYFPVRDKTAFVVTSDRVISDDAILGTLCVQLPEKLSKHDRLFLEKYANRVGFCLHNKVLALRNERHILFLRKLAHDIGHNIITPNMRLKLLISQLEKQIKTLGDLSRTSEPDEALLHDLRVLQDRMKEQTKGIMDTFKNSALFLESLLRQSHFDFGRYVLRPSQLDLCKIVVVPQFERYRGLFEERGIFVNNELPTCPEAPCIVEADLGLISQVLANFFSNAVKYTSSPEAQQRLETTHADNLHPKDVHSEELSSKKAGASGTVSLHSRHDFGHGAEHRHNAEHNHGVVQCTVHLLPKHFPNGADGVKVAVFSSGKHIQESEAAKIFEDNYRASNSSGQYGTGHGLYFVREIIAEHNGESGYEPAEGGNVFYFILPRIIQ